MNMRTKVEKMKKSGLSDAALLAISILILIVGIILIFLYYGKLL